MSDLRGRASFKLVSALAVLLLTYLIFRGSELATTFCTTGWALHLLAMDGPEPECNQSQLPPHLSLYASFQYNRLSAAQATALADIAGSTTHPLIVRTVGLTLIEQDQPEVAAQFWQDVKYYSGLEQMTQQLVEEESYEKALALGRARQVLRQFDASDWQFYLAMIMAEINTTRDVAKILTLANEITTLNPSLSQLYTWTGNALMEKRDYAAASRVYQAGVIKFPTESGAWFGLGRSVLATNDFDAMCRYFEKGLQLDYSPGACSTVIEHCRDLVSSEIQQLCSDQ